MKPLSLEHLVDRILAFPSEERALLVDHLAKRLDPADNEHVRGLWVSEASRRVREVRNGIVQTVDGESVLAEARALLKK